MIRAPVGPDNSKGRGCSIVRRLLRDWLLPIAVAVILALVIKTYVVEAFQIPSGSMEPTIMIGDRVIVEKLFFHPGALRRDDVIVFWPPAGVSPNGDPLIKRVIGLPGDTVLIKGGTVYVDGRPLQEPYIAEKPDYDYGPVTVPSDKLFMMGDNRNHSFDSRNWGFENFNGVVGKAVWIYWPLDRFGKINGEPD
jgi:signal peptidase I